MQHSLSLRSKCQDSSNPFRIGEKTETKCLPKTGCAEEDEMRGRMKKLLKQRNTSICNNSRETAGEQLQSKTCLALPGVPPAALQPVPRSCWAASLPGSLWSQLSKPWDSTRNTTGGTQHTHGPQGVPRMWLRGHTEHPHLSPLEGWQHI